jgi:hypothetical protein
MLGLLLLLHVSRYRGLILLYIDKDQYPIQGTLMVDSFRRTTEIPLWLEFCYTHAQRTQQVVQYLTTQTSICGQKQHLRY